MAAEKFPSFNFFPADWIASTGAMSALERGAFIHLLAYAWEQNPPCTLPDDDAQLATMAGVSPAEWRKIRGKIRKKFEAVDGGLLVNPKQAHVYQEMVTLRQKRRSGGQQGARVRWQSDSPPIAEPLANTCLPVPFPMRDANASLHPPLRAHMRGFEESLDRLSKAALQPTTWEAALFGMFGPNGTDRSVWKGVQSEAEPQLLAIAVDRLAGEAQAYKGNFFRAILQAVIREQRNGDRRPATGTDGARQGPGWGEQAGRRRRTFGAE